jgi:hypothetical protein
MTCGVLAELTTVNTSQSSGFPPQSFKSDWLFAHSASIFIVQELQEAFCIRCPAERFCDGKIRKF